MEFKWWNNDKCWCECKKHHICETYYVWNPAPCSCENGKYLASTVDGSAIKCDGTVNADAEAKSNEKETKTFPIIFNEKKVDCKTQNCYILLAFSSISIALLIDLSIYCHLVKYRQNINIYYHFTSQITN